MQELGKILDEIEEYRNHVCKDYSRGVEFVAGAKRAFNGIDHIIRKHINDGWIAVDERLPEEAGTYIINALTGERNIVTFAKWQNRYKRFDMTGSRTYWKIIAWRPLPEPYHPERSEK